MAHENTLNTSLFMPLRARHEIAATLYDRYSTCDLRKYSTLSAFSSARDADSSAFDF